MSPQADHDVESAVAQQTRELTYSPETPGEDRVNLALGESVTGLANLDRAIRNLPFITSVADLHPDKIATLLKRAREAALAEHPEANLNAVAAAAAELHEFIDRLVTDPEAAILNNPEHMKDAMQGITRKLIDTYRRTLYAALPDVRAAQERG